MNAQDCRVYNENDKKCSNEVIPFIPEIIDEKITDSKGKCFTQQITRGKLLGKGGFGRCYVGTVNSTNTVYALKIVPKSNLIKSKAKQKLQSEIRIHRDLKNQYVVRFERHFEDIHNVYIVLELCSNNSMSEMLKRRKKLLEVEVRYYLNQLVSSLQYLHKLLIIHRDLKLGNLFIDSNMHIKVGDFGLATKLLTADERRKTVCGTPNYLAPEILAGKEGHSFPVDIWSTGVVMYTLLIGKPPFESTDMKSTYKRILANSYTFPDHTIISENAKSLIRSMLQHREEKRPNLSDIMNHPFFTSPSSFMPSTIPEIAVREVPVIIPTNEKTSSNMLSSNYNDENDPLRINSLNYKLPSNHTNDYENKYQPAKRSNQSVDPRSKISKVMIDDNVVEPTRRPSTGRSTMISTTTTNTNSIKSTSKIPVVSATTNNRMTTRYQAQATKKFDIYPDNGKLTYQSNAVTTNSKAKVLSDEKTNSRRNSLNKYPSIETIQDELEKLNVNDNIRSHTSKYAWSKEIELVSEKAVEKQSDKKVDKILEKQMDRKSEVVTACAITITTPPDQIINPTNEEQKGTLEVMHDMLDRSFITTNVARKINLDQSINLNVSNDHLVIPTAIQTQNNIWVVRYVDYTSKYGLGFLLNTGSSGVYFNDSTKIILSSDGLIFQYIERNRNLSNNSPINQKNDYIIQTHQISSYPVELQKKVTLLKHFRNYLIEQHNISSDQQDGIVSSIPMIAETTPMVGANNSVPFGISSYNDSNIIDLPFVKKWVRTRHAILFRLSNRIVQVIFFDKSEILLTSDAHVVTYVNKQGHRCDYSIEDVMQAGRIDIAKRLRYTKDIMHRLINIQIPR